MKNLLNPEIEVAALFEHCRTLTLATMDTHGIPQSSPAPFVRDEENRFYVLVSALAPHTAHLAALKPTGVLLIEDEHDALDVFARKRMSYVCAVAELLRDTSEWRNRLDRLNDRFGAIVATLAALPDFRMFRLAPLSGRLVIGFGRAYRVKDGVFTPIGPAEEAEDSKS